MSDVRVRALIVALVVVSGLWVDSRKAEAQRWRQTSELEAPVERGGPTGVLLDTITQKLSRIDSLRGQRGPSQGARLRLDELRKRLTDRPWIQEILRNEGLMMANCAGVRSFADLLAFARMRNGGGRIVEIGERPVRDGFESKKRQLTEKIERLTYETQ